MNKDKVKKGPYPVGMEPMVVSWTMRKAINLPNREHTRIEVVKKLWRYIVDNKLQDKANRRNINCDENLEQIFGKKMVSMFEMSKLVSKHMTSSPNALKRRKLQNKLLKINAERESIERKLAELT